MYKSPAIPSVISSSRSFEFHVYFTSRLIFLFFSLLFSFPARTRAVPEVREVGVSFPCSIHRMHCLWKWCGVPSAVHRFIVAHDEYALEWVNCWSSRAFVSLFSPFPHSCTRTQQSHEMETNFAVKHWYLDFPLRKLTAFFRCLLSFRRVACGPARACLGAGCLWGRSACLFYSLIANWALGVFIQRRRHDVERWTIQLCFKNQILRALSFPRFCERVHCVHTQRVIPWRRRRGRKI